MAWPGAGRAAVLTWERVGLPQAAMAAEATSATASLRGGDVFMPEHTAPAGKALAAPGSGALCPLTV
ncbi:MAG TPA: hypothetical protein VHE78_09835 [Gemmatimonadaceae bacterium]|nr:hypothetical protein [Gemmatimonadaceae bacterium]